MIAAYERIKAAEVILADMRLTSGTRAEVLLLYAIASTLIGIFDVLDSVRTTTDHGGHAVATENR